jgi:transcriptional regulator with XRE-family HTH domain
MNLPTTPPTMSSDSLDHAAIGALIRKARTSKRIGLQDLAMAMAVSAPYLSDLERGRRNWTVERYAQAVKLIKKL